MTKVLPLNSLPSYDEKIKEWVETRIKNSEYDDTELKEQINTNKDEIDNLKIETGLLEQITESLSDDLTKNINNLNDVTEVLETNIGNLENLDTTVKSDLVSSINEIVSKVDEVSVDSEITISTNDTTEGMAKSYTIAQGGTEIGVIDIPKDMVVSSGKIEVDPSGMAEGTYIVLTLANATNDTLYIDVGSLVDIYTVAKDAVQIQLAITAANEISAIIVAGSITATELADNAVTTAKIADGNVTTDKLSTTVQSSLDKAESAVQSVATGTSNGTISVDGSNVSVKGLGSAAYTESTAYDEIGAADAVQKSLESFETEISEKTSNAITEEEPYYAVSTNPEWYPPHESDGITSVLGTMSLGDAVLGVNENNWTTEHPDCGEEQYLWLSYLGNRVDGSVYWINPVLLTDEYLRDNAVEVSKKYAQLVLDTEASLAEKADLSALTDGSVTKIGMETIGSGINPIYLDEGIPVASDATVGDDSTPVYLNAGVLTTTTALNAVTIAVTNLNKYFEDDVIDDYILFAAATDSEPYTLNSENAIKYITSLVGYYSILSLGREAVYVSNGDGSSAICYPAKYGGIRLYDLYGNYSEISGSKTYNSQKNINLYLPNSTDDGYLVATENGQGIGVGDTDTPVYINSNGIVKECNINITQAQSGYDDVSFVSVSSYEGHIEFPTSFSSAPNVVLTLYEDSSTSNLSTIMCTRLTYVGTTYFSYKILAQSSITKTFRLYWIAIC